MALPSDVTTRTSAGDGRRAAKSAQNTIAKRISAALGSPCRSCWGSGMQQDSRTLEYRYSCLCLQRISGNAEERNYERTGVLRPEAEGPNKKNTHTHTQGSWDGGSSRTTRTIYFIVYRICTCGSESDGNITNR